MREVMEWKGPLRVASLKGPITGTCRFGFWPVAVSSLVSNIVYCHEFCNGLDKGLLLLESFDQKHARLVQNYSEVVVVAIFFMRPKKSKQNK